MASVLTQKTPNYRKIRQLYEHFSTIITRRGLASDEIYYWIDAHSNYIHTRYICVQCVIEEYYMVWQQLFNQIALFQLFY